MRPPELFGNAVGVTSLRERPTKTVQMLLHAEMVLDLFDGKVSRAVQLRSRCSIFSSEAIFEGTRGQNTRPLAQAIERNPSCVV